MADEIRYCGERWTLCDGDCAKCVETANTYTTNGTEANDPVRELLGKRGDLGE